MQYTSLGRSGLQVSRLALGTMNFGELTGEAAAFQIMDVDGGPQSPDMEKWFGTSEEIIGRWLAQGGRRDRLVRHIRRACDNSLRRLQTDHIDLYQMHHVDRRSSFVGPFAVGRDHPTAG